MTPSEKVRKPKPQASAGRQAPGRAGTYRHERYLQEQLRRGAAMAPERAVTAEHVRDVILKDLERSQGRDEAWTVEFVRKARDSWLFRANTPLTPWPLAVKVYCSAMPQGLPGRQLTALQRYHAAMASRPGLTVPAPWAALPQHRTLIMEWIDAPRVDKLLMRIDKRPERDRIMAAAGRWLRQFHDSGEQGLQPLKDVDLLQPVHTYLGERGGANARDPVFRAAYGVLQERMRDLADTKIPFVMAHGDFSPGNLFHRPERTVGFDFKANQARPAVRDILHFLVYARSFNTPAWMLLTSDVDRDDLDAFLGAYGALGGAMDDRLLTVFRLAEALQSWSHLLDRMRREGSNIRRMARAWRLRNLAKRAIRGLERG